MTTVPIPERFAELRRQWLPKLREPDWYLTVVPDIQDWIARLDHEPIDVRESGKQVLYDFFEDCLVQGRIALGSGTGFDRERRPIDTIVVHHTSNPPGMRVTRLSAIELVRLYAPYFMGPTDEVGRGLKGTAVFSGHVRGGRQVFWPYHWIVRSDGRADRLLDDAEIGWHAGRWDVNCRSVGIVLDGDYEWERPSRSGLQGLTQVIAQQYATVPMNRILGHQEVNPKTTCPSRLFRVSGGWKDEISTLMEHRAAA